MRRLVGTWLSERTEHDERWQMDIQREVRARPIVPLRLSLIERRKARFTWNTSVMAPHTGSEQRHDFVAMFDTSITHANSQSETLAFDTCRLMSRCIPLRSFDYTYEYLFALDKSFIAR